MHTAENDLMSKSGQPPAPGPTNHAAIHKGSSGTVDTVEGKAGAFPSYDILLHKTENTYADHYSGSIPEVEAKAPKATFSSSAVGPAPKSAKAYQVFEKEKATKSSMF